MAHSKTMAATKSKLIAPTDPKTHTELVTHTHAERERHTHSQLSKEWQTKAASERAREREGEGQSAAHAPSRLVSHFVGSVVSGSAPHAAPAGRHSKYLLLSAGLKTKQSASTKHSHQLLSRFCTCKSRSNDAVACELR